MFLITVMGFQSRNVLPSERAAQGYSHLASFGDVVPETVRNEALSKMKKVDKGEFISFRGPIKDRNGRLKVAAGQTLNEHSLKKIDWVVEGVEGSMPKG